MRRTLLAATVAVMAWTVNAHAQFDPAVIGPVVNHWQFNEANDTPLTGAADSVGTSAWSYDLGFNPDTGVQTSTIQDGAFEIRRPGAGHHINSFAPVEPGAVASNKLFLIADLTWDYTESTSPADARFAFHGKLAGENETSPTVPAGDPVMHMLAEITLRRTAPDEVSVGAFAFDAVGNNLGGIARTPLFTGVQEDPVRFVLELDQVNNLGAIHWSTDSGATYSTLGGDNTTFATATDIDPTYVRLGALNNFVSGDGEGLRIHSLSVAIPEPSSLALCLLAAVGMVFARRRACRVV